MPQPWPQVSPVQTKLVAAGWTAAVRSRARALSPRCPSSSSNQRSTAYSRPGARSRRSSLAVKSLVLVAVRPTWCQDRGPLDTSATRRPGPFERAQRTADPAVTSPLCTPEGSVSRRRTSVGAAPAGEATPVRASPAEEARNVRRPRVVMPEVCSRSMASRCSQGEQGGKKPRSGVAQCHRGPKIGGGSRDTTRTVALCSPGVTTAEA